MWTGDKKETAGEYSPEKYIKVLRNVIYFDDIAISDTLLENYLRIYRLHLRREGKNSTNHVLVLVFCGTYKMKVVIRSSKIRINVIEIAIHLYK